MAPPLCNVLERAAAPLLDDPVPATRCRSDQLILCESGVLGRDHAAEIERLYFSLDREARCDRFGHASSDASIAAHIQHALSHATRIIGVSADGKLRGLLEIYEGRASGPVEAALIVEQGWRRRGLGWVLLQDAMRWGRDAGAESLRLIFSRHNWPMRHLCSKALARFDLVLDEFCADIICENLAASDGR
jgi:GNAT superfamily N-acetyltransferase